MSMCKEIKKLKKVMKKHGWKLRQGRNSHTQCKAPDGVTIITLAHTPDNSNFMYDIKRSLRKVGYLHLLDEI